MCCSSLSLASQSTFSYSWQGQKASVLTDRLKEIESNPEFKAYAFKESYNETFTTGTLVKNSAYSLLFVTVVALAVLAFTGQIGSFPQNLIDWARQINPIHAAIGGGIAAVLIGGAIFIIYRATHKKDQMLESDRGSFRNIGDQLMVSHVTYKRQNSQGKVYSEDSHFYFDRSTLDENGDGKIFFYYIKDPTGHCLVSNQIGLLAPVYMVAVIAYNAFRAIIIPFCILFRLVVEKTGCMPPVEGARPFELSDIPKEFAKSIKRVVQAPFYALAYFMAALYTFVNPMGGRKLGASIERDWNDEVSLNEGYWSVGGAGDHFHFEGGGGPEGLGRTGFYLAGCWQPSGVGTIKGGKFVSAQIFARHSYEESSAAVDTPLTASTQGEQLFQEARALKKAIG